MTATTYTDTPKIFDGIGIEEIGPDLYEVIAAQVALNTLGENTLRADYAPVVRRSEGRSVNLALSFASWREACIVPAVYKPSDAEERLYFLPWAV